MRVREKSLSSIDQGEDIVNGLLQQRQKSTTDARRRTLMPKIMVLGSMFLSLLILTPYGFADEGTMQGTGTHM